MSLWLKAAALLLVITFILSAAGWWALPRVIEILPGEVRGRLPEELVVLLTTPLPTALPAPLSSGRSAPVAVTIPSLEQLTPTATTATRPTLTPTLPTDVVSATPMATVAASPTATETEVPTATATATPEPPPPAARIQGLTVIPQKFNNCGPANLTMNLNFYGHQTDQLDVQAALKPNYDDRNVSPEELVGYVNLQTPLRAAAFGGGDLDLLKQFIAAGFPVIIEKGLLPSEHLGWMGHYLTVHGYNDEQQVFYSMDTYLGPWDSTGRSDSYDSIARLWSQFNHTFIIVYRPDQEMAVQRILGSQLLDPSTMWQRAALKAQNTLEREPQNAYAWFNLGTSLTELGKITGETELFTNAAAAFDRARELGLPWRMLWYQFRPYEAYLAAGRFDEVLLLAEVTLSNSGGRTVEETYLYQGQALQAQGNLEGAKAAYQRAIQLNPNFVAASQALADIGG